MFGDEPSTGPQGPFKAETSGFEIAIARIEQKLSERWRFGWERPAEWVAVVEEPERLLVQVQVHGPMTDLQCVQVRAVLGDLDLPPRFHGELVLFCVTANRFFRHHNLYVVQNHDHESLVSCGVFQASAGMFNPPASTVEALVWYTIKGAFVAAPAVRAIVEGADAVEALKVADRYDDSFRINDLLRRSPIERADLRA